jgi:hypothetical protein
MEIILKGMKCREGNGDYFEGDNQLRINAKN